MNYCFRLSTNYFLWIVLLILPFASAAENNIQFLSGDIIKNLRYSVFEIVVAKVESDKISYEKPLPFEKLSFKQRTEKYFSIGTAFFINDKELMTAAHVLNLEYFTLLNDFFIRDENGKVYKIKNINKFSSRRDMTIFDLDNYPSKSIALTFSSQIDIGDTVFSVGNAQGEGISFRAGQVASFTPEREFGQWKDIRFTSPASPGNSGGPLINLKGQVHGLIIQKNASENYNVAVPISEMKNLTNTADFIIRNVSMSLNDKQNNYSLDWTEQFKLPDSLENLALKAQASLNSHYEKVSDGVYKKYETKYFPKGDRFRAYLRDQVYIKQFGVLNSDVNFSAWSLNNYSPKTVAITEDQDVTISKSDLATFHMIIQKPKDSDLKSFILNPKQMMDNMLLAFPLSRSIAVEKIRITSLGEPESTEEWQDKLGRKWRSSLWYMPYTNYFVYSHCLPHPNGVICNVDINEVWKLKTGYQTLMKENLNEVVVGYEGELYDWIEYLMLDEVLLPAIFKDSSIKFENNILSVKMKNFNFDFDGEKISKKTNLHLHFGYANNTLLGEDLLLFELFPKLGVNSHYRIQKYFSPSKFSADEYKSIWDELSETDGDYSGKVISSNKNKIVRHVMPAAEKDMTIINGKHIKQKTVVSCYFKFSENHAIEKCDGFSKNVMFN